MVALYRLHLIAQPLDARNTVTTDPVIRTMHKFRPTGSAVKCLLTDTQAHTVETCPQPFFTTDTTPVNASAAAITSNEVNASLNPSG